jgi:hypothetical protein
MNRLEARIRDNLAAHLELIEDGLRLVSTELAVESPFGAGGVIDILARDRFGHLVVVEIKRSDQSARSALHEITKYVALLKSSQGVPAERIRTVLVSTSWHELEMPFREYQESREVPLEGFVIVVDPEGRITSLRPFVPSGVQEPLGISAVQDYVLFSSATERDRALPRVVSAAQRASLRDFCVLAVDHAGANERVVYPHGLYLVFSSPMTGSEEARSAVRRAVSWQAGLDHPDENFLIAFRNALGDMGDESGMGRPEVLAEFARSWKLRVAHRNGRYQANTVTLGDEQIIREAGRIEGGASYYLERVVSPRYPASWNALAKDLKPVLAGAGEWERIFPLVLSEVARKHPQATVSVHAYNFADIVLSLAKLGAERTRSFLPYIQIVVSGPSGSAFYAGMLVWNGLPAPSRALEWIHDVYGSTADLVLMKMVGAQVARDDRALRALGIAAAVYEVVNPGGAKEQSMSRLLVEGRALFRCDVDADGERSMAEFGASNEAFLADLVRTVQGFVAGWVDGG